MRASSIACATVKACVDRPAKLEGRSELVASKHLIVPGEPPLAIASTTIAIRLSAQASISAVGSPSCSLSATPSGSLAQSALATSTPAASSPAHVLPRPMTRPLGVLGIDGARLLAGDRGALRGATAPSEGDGPQQAQCQHEKAHAGEQKRESHHDRKD
jgi:hypothetical protein